MRSVWNGAISFGLVNIPVKLASAVDSKSLGMHLLCKKCKTRIHYKRFCDHCEEEVPWKDVIKGIEIRKGVYIALDKEQLKKIKPQKTNTIDIIAFIDEDQLDILFYNKHYFAIPERPKEKAYFLFKEILQSTAKLAIGRFVLREKEYICAIGSYKKGLLLTTLNYSYEIRDINKAEELQEEVRLTNEELTLAGQLINQLYQENFQMNKFKDTFAEQVKDMVVQLEKGHEIITAKGPKIKKEKSLIDALRASVKKK